MSGLGGWEGPGASQEELEEEMKIEWINRGLPPNEFTVDGLEEIWDREDKEGQYLTNPFESNLAVKLQNAGAKAFVSSATQEKPLLDRMQELAKQTYKDAQVTAKVMAFKASRLVEPPFARKLRLAKEHHARINQQFTEADKLFEEREKVRKVRRKERLLELKADQKRRRQVEYEAPLKKRAAELEEEYKKKDQEA